MKSTGWKNAFGLFSVLCISSSISLNAQAQSWPDRTVRMIAPFPAGGPVDTATRYLANKLSLAIGQPVVVENVPGAAGGIGMQRLARSAPDGYTLGFAHVGTHAINPHIYSSLGYDPVKDFAPVSQVLEYENILVVSPKQPYQSVGDLIAQAKAKPSSITYGSAGNGSSNHLSGVLLSSMSDATFTHVPYKGNAPSLVAVLAGEVDFMFDLIVTSKPQIEAGKLRAIATTGRKRSAQLPDVPTVSETIAGYEVSGWGAIMAPAGTPDPIIRRLASEFEKIVNSVESAEIFARQGFTQAFSPPEKLAETVSSDLKRWGEIVKTSGAQVN